MSMVTDGDGPLSPSMIDMSTSSLIYWKWALTLDTLSDSDLDYGR